MEERTDKFDITDAFIVIDFSKRISVDEEERLIILREFKGNLLNHPVIDLIKHGIELGGA